MDAKSRLDDFRHRLMESDIHDGFLLLTLFPSQERSNDHTISFGNKFFDDLERPPSLAVIRAMLEIFVDEGDVRWSFSLTSTCTSLDAALDYLKVVFNRYRIKPNIVRGDPCSFSFAKRLIALARRKQV